MPDGPARIWGLDTWDGIWCVRLIPLLSRLLSVLGKEDSRIKLCKKSLFSFCQSSYTQCRYIKGKWSQHLYHQWKITLKDWYFDHSLNTYCINYNTVNGMVSARVKLYLYHIQYYGNIPYSASISDTRKKVKQLIYPNSNIMTISTINQVFKFWTIFS